MHRRPSAAPSVWLPMACPSLPCSFPAWSFRASLETNAEEARAPPGNWTRASASSPFHPQPVDSAHGEAPGGIVDELADGCATAGRPLAPSPATARPLQIAGCGHGWPAARRRPGSREAPPPPPHAVPAAASGFSSESAMAVDHAACLPGAALRRDGPRAERRSCCSVLACHRLVGRPRACAPYAHFQTPFPPRGLLLATRHPSRRHRLGPVRSTRGPLRERGAWLACAASSSRWSLAVHCQAVDSY